MKCFLLLVLIVGLFVYIIFASNTFQVHTSTVSRRGLQYEVQRFEWHWENFISYIKDLPERIQAGIKDIIYNLRQKSS